MHGRDDKGRSHPDSGRLTASCMCGLVLQSLKWDYGVPYVGHFAIKDMKTIWRSAMAAHGTNPEDRQEETALSTTACVYNYIRAQVSAIEYVLVLHVQIQLGFFAAFRPNRQ